MFEIAVIVLEEAGIALNLGIPPYIIRLGLSFINILLCLGVHAAFGPFLAQGAVLLGAEPVSVIKNGVLLYFVTVALVVMLSLTIVLLPIALIFLIACLALLLFGQASLAMLIGLAAGRRLRPGQRLSPSVCLLIGGVIINIITNVPYVSIGAYFVFLPVLYMGITVTAAINGLVKKKFYYAPFKKAEKQRNFDRAKMREIIIGRRLTNEKHCGTGNRDFLR